MEKVRLIVMCGIPGSGKSTCAKKLSKKYDAYIVSSDKIREKMFGDARIQKDGDKVFGRVFSTARKKLSKGHSVIIDCVNTKKRDRARYIKEFNGLFDESILVYMNTPEGVCISRNQTRERVVPESAMKRYLTNFIPPDDNEGYDKLMVAGA